MSALELAAREVAPYCTSTVAGSVAGELHCVEASRRRLHVASEAAALILGVPFLFWAATTTVHPFARIGLRTMAYATIAVDGWLLSRWLSEGA